jgi:uncharacterized protein (TIGR03083 family)
MNDFGRLDVPTYLEHVRADARATARAVRRGPLGAPVPACDGWSLADLVAHLGGVHRWVLEAVTTGERPLERDVDPAPTDDADALAAWLLDGADRLVDLLASRDPGEPTWHPFPAPRHVAVWPRRQAHETSIHRWDAEAATGAPSPIDPALASDGIDEYFELGLPRLVVREGITLPPGSLHVHCTDVDGEWLVDATGGELALRREHAKGDAAVRGPAEVVLLALWNRVPLDAPGLELIGDVVVARAWFTLPGL